MPGYRFRHADSLTNTGDVGLYIKDYVNFTVMNDITINISVTENLCIKIKIKKHKIISVVYRHALNSTTHITKFNKKLNQITLILNLQKSEFYIAGDINVDLLQI